MDTILRSLYSLTNITMLVNTFAVNYYGRPYMKDIYENKLFYRNLQILYVLLISCALEIFPPLNDMLQLSTLPTVVAEAPAARKLKFWYKSLDAILSILTFPGFITSMMILDTLLSWSFERTVRIVYSSTTLSMKRKR
jgi:hypothetical protein